MVIADVVQLCVLASEALVLLSAVLRNAFIDSNPRRGKSSVIKKKKYRVESTEVLLEDERRADYSSFKAP